MRNNFWDTPLGASGWFHTGCEAGGDRLLVFVHGIRAHCIETWGDSPRFLWQALGKDLPCMTYAFPAGFLNYGVTIGDAAEQLALELEGERCRGYRHIVLLTHSTGGLIAKELIRRSAREIGAMTDHELLARDTPPLAARIRVLLFFDVPHDGANPLVSAVIRHALPVFRLGLDKAVYLVSAGRIRQLSTGIFGHLDRNDPYLVELNREYENARKTLHDRQLPVPWSGNLQAAQDHLVERNRDENGAFRQTIRLHAWHGNVKKFRSPNDPKCRITAGLIREPLVEPYPPLVMETLVRLNDFLCKSQVSKLIGDAGKDHCIAAPVGRHVEGSQAQVLERLRQEIARAVPGHPQRIVVTGEAGHGKSIVLRTLARELAIGYLESASSQAPIPFFIPLMSLPRLENDQAALFREVDGEGLLEAWRLLLSLWVQWREGRSGACQTWEKTLDALETALETRPAVLFMDGLDEFLLTNSAFGLDEVADVLSAVCAKHAAARSRLTIVIGVRSSVSGVNILSGDALQHTFVVRRPSPSEATEILPEAGEWLERQNKEELREALLTPLFLNTLRQTSLRQFSRVPELFELAVRRLIERDKLPELLRSRGHRPDVDDCLSALTIIGWQIFCSGQQNIRVARLAKDVAETCERLRHRIPAGQDGGRIERFLRGAELARKEELLEIMCRRTVLYETGPGECRIVHLEWQEYLCARYLALVVRASLPEELKGCVATPRTYQLAGDLLGDFDIRLPLVTSFFDCSAQAGRFLVAGNFAAIVAQSRTRIDGPAAQALLDRAPELGGLGYHGTLGTLAYRALRQSDDPGATTLMRLLEPALRRLVEEDSPNRVTVSAAWCYLAEFSRRFGTAPPPGPMPGLQGLASEEEQALIEWFGLARRAGDGFTHEPQQAKIQDALASYPRQVARERDRAIGVAHYAYLLCLLTRHNAHVGSVAAELADLVGKDGLLEKMVWDSGVPELERVLQACRTVHWPGAHAQAPAPQAG